MLKKGEVKMIHKMLKECEIEYRTIYQMRHTFATIMIEHGEDIL